MKVVQLGSNQTVLILPNGDEVLFSYEVPVAGFSIKEGYWKHQTKFSRTTSKHINTWLNGKDAILKSSDEIDELMSV